MRRASDTLAGSATVAAAGADPYLLLQAWLSPAFPVGGFAYSHGLEAAVEAGDVHDAESLRAWLADLVAYGPVRNDMLLVAAAWRAARAADGEALHAANELALAMAPSRERHLETVAQGDAFVAAARAAFPCRALDRLADAAPGGVAYPVALGVAAAGHEVALAPTCRAWGLAFVAALVSAAVRLGPVGQTDGQKTIAALMDPVCAMAARAEREGLDDLGSFVVRSDLASMWHETQYSRLFRS
jgi:urease accessory protein